MTAGGSGGADDLPNLHRKPSARLQCRLHMRALTNMQTDLTFAVTAFSEG